MFRGNREGWYGSKSRAYGGLVQIQWIEIIPRRKTVISISFSSDYVGESLNEISGEKKGDGSIINAVDAF